DLSETSESSNAIIITKKQRYRIDLSADWPANYIIESSSKTPLQIQVTIKLEPSDFVGSRPVSPVLIPSIDNVDNSNIAQPETLILPSINVSDDKQAHNSFNSINIQEPNSNSKPRVVLSKTSDNSFLPLNTASASKNQTYYTTNTFQITRKNKLVSPFISVPNDVPPVIFLEAWENKIQEYTFTKNDSDTNENIDEARRQLKLKKEKNKPTTVQCFYDLSGNAYLQENFTKYNLRSYISKGSNQIEETEISDLFDYYYGEELSKKNTYQMGELSLEQYLRLQSFLE
ncbi:26397_t:CDS:2, partial [Dentiscutata erythropus]